MHIQSDAIEKNCIYLQAKYRFHAFLEILQDYANLFWVLWACLVIHNQNDTINLYKPSMFICLPKINFIIYLFLEILYFTEPWNFIG